MWFGGLKKTENLPNEAIPADPLELDELYWFVEKKPRTKTRENVYIITMVSRVPRQIVSFDVALDKSPERVQQIVDGAAPASHYCTDGWSGYVDVIYPGEHIRNTHDKSDTFTVEGINAVLRHYIPGLARRSRCFYRSFATLKAVLRLFVHAYNKFGQAKSSFPAFSFAFVNFL